MVQRRSGTASAGPRFIDANVFLRYLTTGDPAKAARARRLLERVERGEEKVTADTLVLFEVVFTLQRTYKVPKAQVREIVGDLLRLPGLQVQGKALCLRALDLYVERNVSFVDAYLAVTMQARGVSEIYSWDADFDKLPGVVRREPNGENTKDD